MADLDSDETCIILSSCRGIHIPCLSSKKPNSFGMAPATILAQSCDPLHFSLVFEGTFPCSISALKIVKLRTLSNPFSCKRFLTMGLFRTFRFHQYNTLTKVHGFHLECEN